MSGYYYAVTELEWAKPSPNLPEITLVHLPKALVHAQEVDEDEWERAINDQLRAHYGQPGLSFGFQPVEYDDFDDFVNQIEDMVPFEGFHSPDEGVLMFATDKSENSRLAIMLLEEAMEEADECDSYTLIVDAGGVYTLTVTGHDGLENLAPALVDKWAFHTEETGDDFCENEAPRELRVHARGDEFRISDIVWSSTNVNLPSTAMVLLPSWLVSAERHVDKREWLREINDQLQAKFGSRAKSFGFARA